jgi:hypothetical protein
VPGAGLEPARNKFHGILSPTCLPIPPPRHRKEHCDYSRHASMDVWLAYKDSNLECLDQNQKCYHYTIGQCSGCNYRIIGFILQSVIGGLVVGYLCSKTVFTFMMLFCGTTAPNTINKELLLLL